jgi:DNA-binding SARP family transcriptional activator
MDFRLLGPLEVTDNEQPLVLGGVKQRLVLAILLLHANDVVSTDRLLEGVWGDEPPATAAKSIQLYVSRLRRELGPGRLATRAPGYALHVEPLEVDLACFERLLAEARRAEPVVAARKLRDALALWRGPALADMAYEPGLQAAVTRLRELRLTAVEERIDAELAAGRHTGLVGELEALVVEHPLRERLRAQLMRALYRSSRQAEALHVYRVAQRELAEELGIEPGEELKQLERAILRHDPGLDGPAREPRLTAARPPSPERSLLVVPATLAGLDTLLDLAAPLAGSDPAQELIIACVVGRGELGSATAALAARAERLREAGLAVRTAAFSSPAPAADVVRLAEQHGVELLLMEAGREPLVEAHRRVLDHAPCDVALLLAAGGSPRDGPVVVPFGAARHDWAALALGVAVARATGAPLRLIGAASDRRHHGRDASRVLADASLLVQRRAGVIAEPMLASPGHSGVVALSKGAGLLVVGLSDRWREEGLGRTRAALVNAPPAPTVLVRRAPSEPWREDAASRFTWSLTPVAS